MATKKRAGKDTRRSTNKRELIDTGRDKRFVRRDDSGRFEESDDVSKSLAQDRRQTAKRTVKSGRGDQGDQKRTVTKGAKRKGVGRKKAGR